MEHEGGKRNVSESSNFDWPSIIGQDPELRYLPTSGQPVTNFSVATDEVYTDNKQGQRQERVDWHNIVVFGKAAESCKEYLKRGREVYV
jgi:single-strand DNA-binding protein